MGGKLDKAKLRLKSVPKDYTYLEAKSLLIKLGYEEYNKGKTSGSRVVFVRSADKDKISLHKPHPDDVMRDYAVRALKDHLEEMGELL